MRMLLIALGFVSTLLAEKVEVGKVIPNLHISEKEGGYVEGGDFNSDDLRGKIYAIMFADPDEKDSGEPLNDALKIAKEGFPEGTFKSAVIINMAATWKPNWIISKILKSKQEKFPGAVFIKDEASITVNEWGLKDNAYECLVIDEKGTLLHRKEGPYTPEEIKTIIALINEKTHSLVQ